MRHLALERRTVQNSPIRWWFVASRLLRGPLVEIRKVHLQRDGNADQSVLRRAGVAPFELGDSRLPHPRPPRQLLLRQAALAPQTVDVIRDAHPRLLERPRLPECEGACLELGEKILGLHRSLSDALVSSYLDGRRPGCAWSLSARS
jgi:hypothetical protein